MAWQDWFPQATVNGAAVDLFCGAGGLTHGFILEGIRVAAGIDVDPTCKYSYEHNNQACFILKDVTDLTCQEVTDLYPVGSVKILAGCAPCQPFSTYTQGRTSGGGDKWALLRPFADLVEGTRPEIVTMENVPRLATHQVFWDFVRRLERLGYLLTVYDVHCPQYGVPQTRKRLVLFGSIFDYLYLASPILGPGSYPTVRDVIGALEPIEAGGVSASDPVHRASRLSEANLRRVRASAPGRTWRDWDEGLVADCHKKESGKTYPSVYGRMEWNKPSPTVTTQCYGFGNGRFGHPEQDRAISLREAALLQTFPLDYEFVEPGEPVRMKKVGRMIGNAVPVQLARVIGRSIRNHVEEHHDQNASHI